MHESLVLRRLFAALAVFITCAGLAACQPISPASDLAPTEEVKAEVGKETDGVAAEPAFTPIPESEGEEPASVEMTFSADESVEPLRFVFVGERFGAWLPDLSPFNPGMNPILEFGPGYRGDIREFRYAERYADWIGSAAGVPIDVTRFVSETSLSAVDVLNIIVNDMAAREAIAAADIVLVGPPSGDLPWNSDVDTCDGAADEPDFAAYTPECANAIVDATSPILAQVFAEVAALRANQPTVLRTTNLFDKTFDEEQVVESAKRRDLLVQYNRALCDAATASGFVCADLFTRFNGVDGTTPAGDLLYFRQPWLLSDKGSETIASELIDTEYTELVAAGYRPHPFAGQDVWLAAMLDYFGAPQTNGQWMRELWLMRPDGTEAHQVATDIPYHIFRHTWSPDGTRLVLEVRINPNSDLEIARIWEYDLATDSSRQIIECEERCKNDYEPDYSPDGTKISLSRDFKDPEESSTIIVETASGEVTQISSGIPWNPEFDPRWSPDGQSFTFWRSFEQTGLEVNQVHRFSVDGSDEQVLTPDDMDAGDSNWSPDGEMLVFTTFPLGEYDTEPGLSDIYRMRPNGTELERLTFFNDPEVRAVTPAYSPDGEWIFFGGRIRPGVRIWAMPANGGDVVFIRRGSTLDWYRPVLQPAPAGD